MASKRTILLIDYDPESIEQTRAPLVRAGYRVEVAGDGQSGIETFAKLGPDLVLIEPMVPKLHGFQVCREIKSTPRGRTTPVLITTAFYRGRKHRSEAQEQYGCDGYLEKPIAEALLLSTCSKFLIDTQHPPLPPEMPSEEPGPGPVSPRARATAVVSFPDLPLTDDREPSRLVALDDLSDEEIQARLDHMILEDDAPASPAPPASPRAASGEAQPAAPAVPEKDEAPTRTDGARSPGAAVATPRGPRPSPPEVAAPPVAPSAAPQRSRVPARPVRPSSRAVGTRPPASEPKRSARALGVGLAAVVCLFSGAGLLWWLGRGDGTAPRAREERSPVTAVTRPTGPPAEPKDLAAPASPESSTAPPAATLEPTATVVDAPTIEAEARAGEPNRVASETPVPTRTALPTSSPDRSQPTPRVVNEPPPKPEPPRAVSPPPSRTPTRKPQAVTPPPVPATEEPAEAVVAPEPEPAVAAAASEADDTAIDSTAPEEAAAVPQASPSFEVEKDPPSVRRGELLALEQVDVAPRPVSRRAPDYPGMARRLRQEGTVVLHMLVDENGRVDQVEVESGNKLLQDAAMRAAKDWRFEPATKDGVPVKVWINETVNFSL